MTRTRSNSMNNVVGPGRGPLGLAGLLPPSGSPGLRRLLRPGLSRSAAPAALALCPVSVCHCLGLNGFCYTNRSYYNPKQCRIANRLAYPLRGDFTPDPLN